MEYKVDDKELNASTFLSFVNQVWQGDYDMERTKEALSKTLNITAYENKVLVGCLRILSDGYYFGTITELLVLPEYQKRGVGSKLLQLAKDNTPTMLYFGSQPEVEEFYEKNGRRPSASKKRSEEEQKLGVFWNLNSCDLNLPNWKIDLLEKIPNFFVKINLDYSRHSRESV